LENLHQIIEGCIANNHRDQRILYENYFGYSLKIVFRYIYRYERAVDVANDGFVKLFKNISKFQYSQSQNVEMMLMGWMRTIMINTAIDQLRKENLLPEIGAIDEHVWQEEDKKGQSPDQALLYKEIVIHIKKLPPSYRIVFNMYVLDGFSHQEIGNQLGISVGTSKSNLFKARAILQKYIRKENECNFAETY
jgi:RNA polymerase sigma factor (sigma-70 family)